MVALHPYPWEVKLSEEKIFSGAEDRNLLNIYFEIYRQYLEFTGKSRWACKSTFMIEHVSEILKYYPEARFIYMVRDGRDVAVSAKSSIFNHYHIYYTAQLWSKEQKTGLHWLSSLARDQIMLLKYEDLLENPVDVTKKICSFINEPFQENMLDYYKTDEAKKSASLSLSWANTSRPVLKNNAEKFKALLSPREKLLFEVTANEEMNKLGYKISVTPEVIDSRRNDLIKPRLKYRLAELFLFAKAEIKHIFKDKNSLTRLKKIWFMRYLRIVRKLV